LIGKVAAFRAKELKSKNQTSRLTHYEVDDDEYLKVVLEAL
jgi:hypothetical protein